MICKKCGIEVYYKPSLLANLFGVRRNSCPNCGAKLDSDTENRHGILFTILVAVFAGALVFAIIGVIVGPYAQASNGRVITTAVRLSSAGWGALLGTLLGLYAGISSSRKR